MFESVGQEGRLNAARYFTSLLVSLVVHTTILCVIVAVPLVFCHALPLDPVIAFLFDPPSAPVPPPPLPEPAKVNIGKGEVVTHVPTDDAPIFLPKGVRPPVDGPMDFLDMARVVKGISGPAQGMGNGRSIVDLLTASKPPELPEPDRPKTVAPVPVESRLQQSKLIFRVDPVYPVLAIKTHTSGTVILEAMIDEEGNVADLKILSGHPLLTGAAVEAVKQWKYLPTILNGEPVPILATVTVVFRFQ